MAEVQTEKNTVLYILYADSVELKDESVAGQKAALFWYGESGVHHCCEAFDLSQKVRCKYIAFFCITLPDMNSPAHPITMTLSEPDGDHIGVAFLDVSQFSAEESFQEMSVELLTAAGVVAVVTLFTARQNRWAYEHVEPTTGVFIEWEKDAQAKMLYDHMMSQDTSAEEEKPKEEKRDEKKEQQEAERRKEEQRQRDAEAAEKRRHEEAEERRKKDEAAEKKKQDEAAAAERRRREEAAAAEEKRRKDEELDREIARRKEEEEERRREDERRRKDEEHRHWREQARAEEDSRRYRDESEDRRERQRRWEEEEEAERRRREDFERRKREHLEKELASSPERSAERSAEPMGRLKERQQWEEDRARLKRDARRVREREIAEHERRAEERRRQIEALTSARLAPAVAPRVVEHVPERQSSQKPPSADKPRPGRSDGRRRGSATAAALRRKDSMDSEVSEPCRFDGEDDDEEDGKPDAPVKRGFNGGFRWPRNERPQRANDTAETLGRRGPGQVVLRGGTQQVSSSPMTELSLAERLEHFRSHSQLKRLGAIQRDVVVDASEGRVPMLETLELAASDALKHQEAAQSQARSVNNTPRKRSTSARSKQGQEAEGPARRANAVLAAVLADAAGAGFGLAAAPVAAVEESVLRLLVLHKELTAGDVAKSKLADATAGLAPRMVQVLEAAKAVCEANRSKLMAYTEEKQLGIDRSDYLVPQMQALEKLHRQYSTLCPAEGQQGSAAEVPLEELPKCVACGADLAADARFCHICGRRQESAPAPPPARFSPRPAPAAEFQPYPAGHSLQSSPVRSAQNTGRQSGFDRPVDPGLPEPLMPALRSGGSTPPAAKFRQQASPPGFGVPQSTPRSDISSVQPQSARPLGPHPGPGGSRGQLVPTIQHWDRHQELAQRRAFAGEPFTQVPSAHISPMWDAVAAAVSDGPPAAKDASPLWDAVAVSVAPVATVPSAMSTARSSRDARLSPRAALVSGGEPLRTALQQTRGVASELSRRGRGGGGAHAGAGSPSPEPRHLEEPVQRAAPEDKYLKILQSLQAKGAANGGLAAQLLEKQAARGRASKVLSSDSDSSEYLPPRRRVRGR